MVVPTITEIKAFTLAGSLFQSVIFTMPYVSEDADERLDLWLTRDKPKEWDPDGLPDEAISVFRWSTRASGEKVLGPWVQLVSLSYDFFPITVIHELAHVIDRYHNPPRTTFTSGGPSFEGLRSAYRKTISYAILNRIAQGEIPTFFTDNEERVVFPEDQESQKEIQKVAEGALHTGEVFARCLTAYILYRAERSSDMGRNSKYNTLFSMFHKRVNHERNQLFGYDLSVEDFEIIEKPMKALLDKLTWSNEDFE